MARCEECIHYDACLTFMGVRIVLCDDKADERCKKFKPPADVAPRAEIDKLQEVNADLNESLRLAAEANKDLQAKVDRWRFGLEAVLEERAEDRAEVAREIFKELDKKIFNHIPDLHTFEIYTDLKKKYTQSEPPKGVES